MAQEPAIQETDVQTEQPPESTQPEPTNHSEGHEAPTGALVFGFLMLAFYAFYFFFQWYEIVVLRGGA